MVAFPIKTAKQDSAISPLFGKAKYFAFYDGRDLEILKNEAEDGKAVINWFAQKGVESIVIKEMGSNPYREVLKHGMKIYRSPEGRIEIPALLEMVDRGELELLNGKQIEDIVKKHEGRHKHDHGHHHGQKRLVFPTNENNGYLSRRGAHFGKADFYTVVTIKENKITDVEGIPNPGHTQSGCGGAVENIMALNPDALIVSGIGSSPAAGFKKAGLDLYFDRDSLNVQDSVNKYIKSSLELIGSDGTCSSH